MLKPWITREVRWFSPGRIPVPVQNWYDLREKQIEPVRTDIYLSGLGTSAGVKLREGRLEIKHRTEDHGLNEFAPGLSGHVENWIKWGFDMSSDDWPGVKSTHWVPIQKKRQIQLYTFTESGAVIQSVPGVLPSQGGGVELCEITASQGQQWWTVGLEVFGPSEHLSEVFEQLAALVFADASWLNSLESLSYPAWLARVG